MIRRKAAIAVMTITLMIMTLMLGACSMNYTGEDSQKDAVKITLSGLSADISGNGAKADGSIITINAAGTYVINGSLSNGQIIVDAADTDNVELVLAGVDINYETGAAVYVKNADNVSVTLESGTSNTLSGGSSYTDNNTVDGVVFSKADITFDGTGSLTIKADYKHGIVSKDALYIAGGTYSIDSNKDAIHAGSSMVIDGGTYIIEAGDDALHAELDLTINDGTITIENCVEGIEGKRVTINGGKIALTASDDGLNAAGDDDRSTDVYIKITGGELYVNASGDGLDSNGDLYITGGTIYVDGPTSNGDGAIDYEKSAQISGGTLVATGSAGMAQGMGSGSEQCSVLVNLEQEASAEDTVTLKDSDGNILVSYTPQKRYGSVVISTAAMTQGSTYTLITGNTETAITLDSVSVIIGNGSFKGMRGDMGERGGFGGQMMPGDRPQENADMPQGNADMPQGNRERPDNLGNRK